MNWQQHFGVERQANVTIIQLREPEGRDPNLPKELEEELLDLIELAQPEKLLVDFSAVGNYPAEAVGSLLKARNELPDADHFKFCGMRGDVRMAYRFLNLDSLFEIHDDVRQALRSFDEPAPACEIPTR